MKLMISDNGAIVELIAEVKKSYLCKFTDERSGHWGKSEFGDVYKEVCEDKCWFFYKSQLKPLHFDNRLEENK